MELAIPLVAVGGLYIASKQKKKENFSSSKLPNVDLKDKNYPSQNNIENAVTDLTSKLSTVNHYDKPQAYTDKYFNKQFNDTVINQDGLNSEYYSLTGNKVEKDYFKHNNMVPFFGGNLKTRDADINASESVLDNYVGAGSQYIEKMERAPFFKPGENYQYPNGTPNQTDFMRSRVNPSSRMANVNPFKDEKVGPGLNLGYTTTGSGGFNSGMMSRPDWQPKTVDELRVLTNQKSSGNLILGYEGHANSYIKNMGKPGKQEKHRPERDFEMTRDRLFTTTGGEIAPTMRSINIEKNVARPETSVDYSGVASYGNSSIYVDGEHEDPHRIQLDSYPVAAAGASGKGIATESDYGMKSKIAYPNNRTENNQDSYFGAIGGAFGAAVAPLLDVLKPTRKENTLGNLRLYENPKASVEGGYVYDPNNKLRTTIKETTENSKMHMNVNMHNRGAYEITKHQPIHNAREDQSDYLYIGNSSARRDHQDMKSYEAEYNQRNNEIKSSTIKGRLVQGNMNLYSGNINQHAKNKDSDLLNNRPMMPQGLKESPSVYNMGHTNSAQPLYQNIQIERNTSDLMSNLQGNPYAIPYKAK